jgi:hypothetical protein
VPWYRRWRSWIAAGLVVAVVGSASGQASASTKPAGLCAQARGLMDELGREGPSMLSSWVAVDGLVNLASKTC